MNSKLMHIDRKMFKMRELRCAGRVVVRHIPGETNPADLFTKVLHECCPAFFFSIFIFSIFHSLSPVCSLSPVLLLGGV